MAIMKRINTSKQIKSKGARAHPPRMFLLAQKSLYWHLRVFHVLIVESNLLLFGGIVIYWTVQNIYVMLVGYVSKKENIVQSVMKSTMMQTLTISIGNNVALVQTGHISLAFKNLLAFLPFLDIFARLVRVAEE
jgi:hypothetical protein